MRVGRLLNRQIVLPLIVEVNSRLKLANCLLLPLNSTLAQGRHMALAEVVSFGVLAQSALR